MSLILTSPSNPDSQTPIQSKGLPAQRFAILALLLTLSASALDQWTAPSLHSSSPLWATIGCVLLIWRRGSAGSEGETSTTGFSFSLVRVSLFAAAHVSLVLVARLTHAASAPAASALSLQGWTAAILKLTVLLPTLLLLPLNCWRTLGRLYAGEGIAALLVLFTFFPSRVIEAVWPWYGQVLGEVVFFLGRLFVHGLSYTGQITPTIHGPDLDVAIVLACSGISGIELFDYLFAFIVFLDWNRLRKGRTLLAYFGGIGIMFFSNALRIACLVIIGNRGFAEAVARFHLSAGWIFFSIVFLLYLSLSYRQLLANSK